MATTLRDFIGQRETEIRDLLKALKAELRELQVAKAALDAGAPAAAPAAPQPTIKDLARDVLADAAKGMTAIEILAAIKEKHGRDIDRTSLSPQLSRLKGDGDVILFGERWYSKGAWQAHQKAMDEIMGANIEPFDPDDREEDEAPF